MCALSSIAILLVLAAPNTENVRVWLNQVHIRAVPGTGGTHGRLHVVLPAQVVVREAVLGVVDLTGHLDVAVTLGEMGRADETLGEQVGFGRKGRVLGAEGDGAVFVLRNIAAADGRHHHAPTGGGGELDDLAGLMGRDDGGGGEEGGEGQGGEGGDVEEHLSLLCRCCCCWWWWWSRVEE